MSTHRLALWLLASAGVVVGHVIGYAVAHPESAERELALVGHGYLGPLSLVAGPLAVAAMVSLALRTVRRAGSAARPRWRELALAQLTLFGALEVLERLGDGAVTGVLAEPAVWCGAVAQVVVALALVQMVGWTARALRWVRSGDTVRTRVAPPPVDVPTPAVPWSTAVRRVPINRRGPPILGFDLHP